MSAEREERRLRTLIHEIRAEDADRSPSFSESWGRAVERHEAAGARSAAWRWRGWAAPLPALAAGLAVVAIALVVWRIDRGTAPSPELLAADDDEGWIAPSSGLLGLEEIGFGELPTIPAYDDALFAGELGLELPTDSLIDDALATGELEL